MAAMPLWRTDGVGRWHLDTRQYLLLPPHPRCRISQIDMYGGVYVNGMVLHYEATDEKKRYEACFGFTGEPLQTGPSHEHKSL